MEKLLGVLRYINLANIEFILAINLVKSLPQIKRELTWQIVDELLSLTSVVRAFNFGNLLL